MKELWTEEVFIPKYKERLNAIKERNRGDGFLRIFRELESRRLPYYTILETGCMRPGYSMDGDGFSTELFDSFVSHYKGTFLSVDITTSHVEHARKYTNPQHTQIFCSDSVDFIWSLRESGTDKFDLIYLDSFDVDFQNPILSNLHHMKELVAISPFVEKGTIIAVDDCRFEANDPRIPAGLNHKLVGKGTFVADFMKNIRATPIFDGYQKAWVIS